MDEWNSGDLQNTASGRVKNYPVGKWDVVMTVTALVSTTAVSFLAAWLTRDVPSRPFWMMGLYFAAPVTALLLSVYFKEKVSSSMTPSTSRKKQILLIGCSILAAFITGCFCQVSNEQAGEKEITSEGWGDVLFILDKSGSMNYSLAEYKLMRNEITLAEYERLNLSKEDKLNKVASNAVIDLIEQMDDKVRAGLLIDAGWEENNDEPRIISLEKRLLPIAALSPEHRANIAKLAKSMLLVNENFPRALEVACDIARQYDGRDGELTIIIISDGMDSTGRFRAADYADALVQRKVKVNYLYVAPDYSQEMSLLAELTGGTSAYIQDRTFLLEQMRRMATITIISYIYNDALRTINESVRAKIVSGVLLLLLGLLIGLSLTTLFSVQGQKRLQMILSPLMAVLAFAILAYGKEYIPVHWIREGIAFSLFGIVLMRRNREKEHKKGREQPSGPSRPNNV